MHTLSFGAEVEIRGQKQSEEAKPFVLSEAKSSQKSTSGGKDWLLRLFDSDFFTEWTAILYLFKSFQPGNRLNQPGIRDYICNKLYSFQPPRIEKHLAQVNIHTRVLGSRKQLPLFPPPPPPWLIQFNAAFRLVPMCRFVYFSCSTTRMSARLSRTLFSTCAPGRSVRLSKSPAYFALISKTLRRTRDCRNCVSG